MTISELTAYRIYNQYISGSALSPLEIVQHMGAMQAQDYNGALWSLGLRTGLTQRKIVDAIEKRDIVRTWPQRGTLHFVPAADAQWQVGLSADRLIKGVKTRHERLNLNEKILVNAKKTLTDTLKKEKTLSRLKVMEVLEQAGINTKNGSGYHILWYLSQTGVLVAGSMEGKQQTFALLDDWVKKSHTYTREDAIAELVKRYFVSHGPATVQDFMWWSGLVASEAKAGLARNSAVLISEKIDGKEYWMKKDAVLKAAELVEKMNTTAFLLPGFDEYMLGYKDRSAALPKEHSNKIVPGGNGMFLSTLIIKGQVVGTWKKEIKKDRVIITLKPFVKLTKAEFKLLEIPAKHYSNFLELPAILTL